MGDRVLGVVERHRARRLATANAEIRRELSDRSLAQGDEAVDASEDEDEDEEMDEGGLGRCGLNAHPPSPVCSNDHREDARARAGTRVTRRLKDMISLRLSVHAL